MRQAALQSEGGARATGASTAPQPPAPHAKELDDALSVASTASLTSHAWSARAALSAAGAAAFARADEFASGADAVLRVAANLADTVFAYPLLGSEPAAQSPEQQDARARVVALEVRSGAAAAVLGAQAAGARVAALVPSQPLPLFLPALFQLARSGRPAVVHLSCAALRSGDLALAGGSFEQLEALQHSGALLLGAASAQELHDLAVVAHVAAARLRKLVVHFFDGARVARERATLSLLAPAALRSLAAHEAAAAPLDAVDAAGLDVAQRVQRVMDDLFPVLHTQYKVFEYTGARDAELVLVVVGDAAAAARQAAQYEQMLGRRVGVVHCRLLLPWSHALFAAALPSTVQRVCVLENVSRNALAMQRGVLLSRHVQVFFQSPHWAGSHTPQVVTGVYGGVFRNTAFSAGMARAALHRLASSPSRRAFVVAKSQELYDAALDSSIDHALPPLDVVFGAPLEVDAALGAQQFVVWGVDAVEQRAGGEAAALFDAALDVLAANPATRVHSLVTHSTAAGGSRPAAALQVRVTPAGAAQSSPFAPVEQADVVVVARPQLLEAFDVASTVKRGGKLLVLTGWKTADDVDESAAFKRAVASRELQLLCVDTDELATRVESHAVAAVAPLVAFLKAAALLNEQVVLALLRARFPADQHATLASLVAAVWGDTNPIVYPAAAWRDLEPQEDQADLPTLSSVRPAAVNLSTAVAPKKRARRGPEVSTATRTAWQVTFPAAFGAAQRVRDHVTDLVTVTKWERLTPADYSRNVFHIEMDTTGTAIRYNIGEALAVFAHNDEKDVLAFLRTYGADPEALVTLPVAAKKAKGKDAGASEGPSGETLTYFQLFAHVLDIFGRPSKKFYEALLARASEPKDKETLEQLLAPEGKDEYKRRVDETLTFADLLAEFPSARPTLQDLIALVPRIKPRHYSIASSMKMNPTSVHLLIVVHDWTTPSGKHRVGQATRFLSSVKVGQQLSVSVCSSVMKLPKNHADPIVMAGLGTGMAPFRAFIQERAFLRAQGVAVGPIALYFGSRSKKQEYLYGAELDAYERDGLVTLLRCAFSRDQPHKVYIQDKIAEDKLVLADWLLNKNGHFYLCGPTWPVADVRAALTSAFELEGGLDARQAGQQIEKMREQGRYVLEVY